MDDSRNKQPGRNLDQLISADGNALSRRSLMGGLALAAGSMGLLSTSSRAMSADAGLLGNGEVYPVVFYLTSLSYWSMHFAGLNDVGKLLNVSFQKLGPTGADIAASVLALEQAAAQNPPGMIVGAIDDAVIGKSINSAIEAGIPVVTMDAPSFSSKQLSYIGTDNEAAGYLCGQRLIKQIGGSGSVMVTTTTVAGPAKAQRYAGFKKAIDETGGKVTIAGTVDDGDQAEKAVTTVGQALQAYPDIKGVFTISAGAGLGTARAARQADKQALPIVAFGNDDASYRLTKEQNLTMVAQDGYKMGFMAGLLIHLAAKNVLQPRYDFKALGSSILPASVDTGIVFVDAKNADSFIGCSGGC